MADVGLLPEGFVPATQADIRAEIEEELRSEFGRSIPLGDGTLLGHLIGILSERLALLWEVAEAVNSSTDPDAATGAALEALCLLTATFRIAAGASVSELVLCGDDGTIVNAGTTFSTESTGKKFGTGTSSTLGQLDDWATNTAYEVGDRVTNSDRCYQCITAGTSDPSSVGPNTTDEDIVDNTVHWTYLGEGQAAGDIIGVAEEDGPVFAAARDITVIETPVGGLNSVINLEDAEEGRLTQSDESLRLLREGELAQPGAGTPDAIRAAILTLDGVTACRVFYNNTDVTDEDGLTPHSCEVLVLGGTDDDIWQALWDNVPIGIKTIGTEVGTVQDSEGFDQMVRFSRPDTFDIYIRLSLTKNTKTYQGDAIVQQAIAEWGDARGTGDDGVASAVSAQAFGVDGVIDVTEVLIYTDAIAAPVAWAPATAYVATPGARSVVTNGGRTYICVTGGVSDGSGGPTGTDTAINDNTVQWRYLGATVDIGLRELALYDTSRITVVSVDGTP